MKVEEPRKAEVRKGVTLYILIPSVTVYSTENRCIQPGRSGR